MENTTDIKARKGGLNSVDKLRAGGLDAKRTDLLWVGVDGVQFAPSGHDLVHPRQNSSIDEAIVADMIENGFRGESPLLLKNAGIVGGALQLYIIDGARRTICAIEAQARLRASGKLATSEHFKVAFTYFTGDVEAALLERIRRNVDPTKRPDAPSVLFDIVRRLKALGADDSKIAAVLPRDLAVEDILGWPNLDKKVQKRLDANEAGYCVIGPLLTVPVADQDDVLTQMVVNGATTPIKAGKVARKATGVVRKKSKAVPAGKQVKLVASLTEAIAAGPSGKKHEEGKLPEADFVAAEIALQVVQRLHGDVHALSDFPALAALVDDAVAKKSKKIKKTEDVAEGETHEADTIPEIDDSVDVLDPDFDEE